MVTHSGQPRTEGGQSGLVRHGNPPFLPGRTRTAPFRAVRLSSKGASRTIHQEKGEHGGFQVMPNRRDWRGSFPGGRRCGGGEPRYLNVCSEIGMAPWNDARRAVSPALGASDCPATRRHRSTGFRIGVGGMA
jgi:hypothetical protein